MAIVLLLLYVENGKVEYCYIIKKNTLSKWILKDKNFNMGLSQFITTHRVKFTCDKNMVRIVYKTLLAKSSNGFPLAKFIADKTPTFYRKIEKIIDELKGGYFFTPLKETLARLPTSDHFQSSHFGEIASGIFAEEVLGLKIIYSKLSLNTAENDNPRKMDLVCYKPNTDPVEFVFCEVKSSPKDMTDGLPAEHNKSCFADLFNSMREYEESDKEFDLTAVKDNLEALNEDKELVRKSLEPYTVRKVGYLGFTVIDTSTVDDVEVSLLATRKSKKVFDVELLAIEGYKEVSSSVYQICERIKKAIP